MDEYYSSQEETQYPTAYLSKTDINLIFFHRDIQQPEKDEFVRSIVK